MAKTDSITITLEPQESPVNCSVDTLERHSKRFKPSEKTNICIFCGSECTTVRWKTIHTLYRICEKSMVQKLLNAAMLFKDNMYTKTAMMCDVGDVFAADIQYHDNCCKSYLNRYHAKIDEIMRNFEMEDLVTAPDGSLKERFLALNLDFSISAHSLTSIRDKLNEDSSEIVSNRVVKKLIIELYAVWRHCLFYISK